MLHYDSSLYSLDLALEILSGHQIRNIVVVVFATLLLSILTTFLLLHGLVALGEFPERGKGIGTELIEYARHKFREFFIFTVAVNSKGVRRDRRMNCDEDKSAAFHAGRMRPMHR